MGSAERKMQPALIHVPLEKDVVYTPSWLAEVIVNHGMHLVERLNGRLARIERKHKSEGE